jgi:hypothetical protein
MFSFQSYTIAIMIGRNSVNRDRCMTFDILTLCRRATEHARIWWVMSACLMQGWWMLDSGPKMERDRDHDWSSVFRAVVGSSLTIFDCTSIKKTDQMTFRHDVQMMRMRSILLTRLDFFQSVMCTISCVLNLTIWSIKSQSISFHNEVFSFFKPLFSCRFAWFRVTPQQ